MLKLPINLLNIVRNLGVQIAKIKNVFLIVTRCIQNKNGLRTVPLATPVFTERSEE